VTDTPTVYREPTNLEVDSFSAATPLRLEERVRISMPDGNVDRSTVTILGSEGGGKDREMTNVMRTVVALEPSSCSAAGKPLSDPGTAVALITRFHNECGRLQFFHARCVFGTEDRKDSAPKPPLK
jgi:hypothetical protein